MADYRYRYADGSEGASPFQKDAQGNAMKAADGRLLEGTFLGTANPQGGVTQGASPTGYFTDYPANPATAPAPAPSPAGGGGAVFGGGGNAGSGGGTGGGMVQSALNTATPATLKDPTPWNITGDQTVAGQIKALTDPNSALAQQFQTAGVKQAASRGLVNSSMAATAGMDSLLRGVTPIATADAATYSKAAGYNADQSNQNNQLQYTQTNQVGMNAANNATSLAQSQLNADTQKYLANLNNQSSQAIAKLNNESQAALNAEKDKNQAILQTSSAAVNAYNAYANALLSIQMNTQMDEGAKRTAIANAQSAYTFAMQAAYKLSTAQLPDFSQQLDFTQPDPNAPGGGDGAQSSSEGLTGDYGGV